MAGDEAGVAGGGASGRGHAAALRAGAGLLGVAFVVHVREWMFLCDDAYIGFRYARNLARHGGLVFNVDPLERVEGYTSLLWVLLLAAGDAVGIDPPALAPVLTAVASTVALMLVCVVVRSLRRAAGAELAAPGLVDLIPAAILVALPEYVVWASSGLETSFALVLVLGAVAAWLRGRIVLAAALAAAAGLTRLDALVAVAAFGLAWSVDAAVRRVRARGALELRLLPWRRIALATLVFAAPLAIQLLWRHAYYGEWLPNTWAIKRHGALLRDSFGRDYVATWASNVRLLWMAPLLLALRPRHAQVLAPLLATLVYVWSVGGDFMAYSRFLLPATALLAVLVGWLLADVPHALARRSRTLAPALALALATGLAVQVPGRVRADEAEAWLPGALEPDGARFEGVHGMDEFARVRVAAGTWMHEHLPPDTVISVGAAGALPYAAQLPAFDVYGLVDPAVGQLAEPATGPGARPGHQLVAPWDHVLARDPDLVCHIGHVGPQRPGPASARRRAGPGWTWACIELGPVPAHGRTLEPGFYCCLRAREHVVGPFGAKEPA